ncbi:MAG: DUF5011 domain-containing protein [Verrucomicrobiota bacterium]
MKITASIFAAVLTVLTWGTTLTPAQAQSSGPGKAISFNGTNGYATVTAATWFTGNFTIEGWVYVRTYNNWSRLIDFGNGPNNNGVYLAVSAGTGGLPTMGVLNGSSPTLSSTQQIPTNQWVHLACTLSNTTGTIYINGVNVGSGTLNIPNNVSRGTNYIGRSLFSGDAYANASFDEIRIWNVAKTPAQLQANMRRSLVGNESGLIGYWRCDEGSSTSIADATGLGHPATLFGGSSWVNSAAQIASGAGSALKFDTSTFAGISHQPALNAYPLTLMTWFRATNGGGALVNKYVSASGNGYNLFIPGSGNLLGWYFRDNANAVFGSLNAGFVADGKWHHAAMVVDATGGRLYLDGVQKALQAWAGTPGPTTTTQSLWFNHYPGDSVGAVQMDETSVWNTNLSAVQIQQYMTNSLAGTESGLLGYWRMDEGIGTNVTDLTGHGYTATLSGNPLWTVSGADLVLPDPAYGINLTGTNNEYLKLTNGVWFNSDFTVEAWVYARSYNNWSRLFDFANGPDIHNVFLALSGGTGGVPIMGVYTNNIGTLSFAANTQLPLNQWVHLACTLSNTTGTIYINSVNVGSGTLNRPANVVRTNNYIGRSNYAGDANANAVFDEFRIWNVARTPLQLQATMRRPLLGSESGLVGYWRFDEGSGTNALDATGQGNLIWHMGNTNTRPAWTVSAIPNFGIGIPLAPDVTTAPASSVTVTSAIVSGTVLPNSLATTAWFVWGTNSNYGNTNAPILISATNTFALTVSNALSALTPATAYQFCLIASNAFGVVAGSNLSFTTLGAAPAITSQFANNINTNAATLNASAAPNDLPTLVWFEWGFDASYGNTSSTFSINATNGANPVAVSYALTGLLLNTVYHFRVVASNAVSVVAGDDVSFITLGAAPSITSQFADNIMTNAATLNAAVAPNYLLTTAWLEWGLDTSYGNTSAIFSISETNGATPVTVSQSISNLTPYTLYHFRLVATNLTGVTVGGDTAFASAGGPPQVFSPFASSIYTNTATLNASINPNYFASGGWFEIATNAAFLNRTTNHFGEIGSGSVAIPVSLNLSNLLPSTVYYVRAGATNLYGGTYGGFQSFRTLGPPIITTYNGSPSGAGGSFQGQVIPNGFATYAWFEYGTTTNYGSTTLGADMGNGTGQFIYFDSTTNSLIPGTLYHFRAVGTNITGRGVGNDLTFTSALQPPTATLLPLESTPSNITFRARINPGGSATSCYFQWGGNGLLRTTVTNISATNIPVTISLTVSNPAALAAFAYRIAAYNSVGSTVSGYRTFSYPTITLPGANPTLFNCTTGSITAPLINETTTNLTLSAGTRNSLALRSSGAVTSWGQTSFVPANVSNIVQIASGNNFHLALNKDGRVFAWGNNFSATNMPFALTTNVLSIAARSNLCLAVLPDRVLYWGSTYFGTGQWFPPFANQTISQIAAGPDFFTVLLGNGQLYSYGNNSVGQYNFGSILSPVVQLAAGNFHTLALGQDNTVYTAGDNSLSQRNVPAAIQGQTVAVAAGGWHNLALLTDGTVVAWGNNADGQCNVPAGLNNVIAIAAGNYHSLALRNNGQIVAWGYSGDGQITLPTAPVPFLGTITTNWVTASFGTNFITYTATNLLGYGAAAATRTVVVQDPITITLVSNNVLTVPRDVPFTDPGATASSTCLGNVTSNLVVTGSVNPAVPGSYLLTYSVTNSFGLATVKYRSVLVDQATPPTLSFQCVSNGIASLQFAGTFGLNYALEVSTNLRDWTPVTNILAGPYLGSAGPAVAQ